MEGALLDKNVVATLDDVRLSFSDSIDFHFGKMFFNVYEVSSNVISHDADNITQDKDVRQEPARPGAFHWNTPETHWKMEAVFRPKLFRNFFR